MQDKIVVVHRGNQDAALEGLHSVFSALSPFILVLKEQKKNRQSQLNELSNESLGKRAMIADV